MYADDTCLLSTSSDGLREWADELVRLENACGLAINKAKTFVINSDELIDSIKQLRGTFLYLGFKFDRTGMIIRFPEKVSEVIEKLKRWKRPSYSIFTRVSIMKSYADSGFTFFSFVQGSCSDDLVQARKDFQWASYAGRHVMVSEKRAWLQGHKGGLGLIEDKVRISALQARLGERNAHDSDMKVHQIYASSFSIENVKLIFAERSCALASESKHISHLVEQWATHSPDHTKNHSVKDFQTEIILHEETPKAKPTKRQISHVKSCRGVKIGAIFHNVRRIANLALRFFMWLFFQGGLRFPHSEECFSCGESLSHVHIFFKCPQAIAAWVKAQRAIDLFINLAHGRGAYCKPYSSEKDVWLAWSFDDEISAPLREI